MRKTTNQLIFILLCLGIFSCEMQEIENPIADSEEMEFVVNSISDSDTDPNLRVAANLIYEETFEGNNPLGFTWKQFPASYSFGVATNPKFQGSKSGKFELRYGDKAVTNSGIRSEVLFPAINHRERWYSFAVNFPSDGFQMDNDSEIISQWHQEGMGGPSASLVVKNDRLILLVGTVPNTGASKMDNIDLGQVPKNSWNEYVFHYIHSNGSDGLIEVWQNGKKIVNRKGGNLYKGKLPSWKIGLYKWTWSSKRTNVSKRVIYFDNVRMGDQNASFNAMNSSGTTESPSGTTTTVPKTTTSTTSSGSSPITGFSLIQANINRNLQEVFTGNSISTTTHKLNIQANVVSGFKGTVSFSLTGTKSQSFTDSTAPFTLFGDDGKGNYYFGSGLPKGSYTLVATPSTGASKTIKFTLR